MYCNYTDGMAGMTRTILSTNNIFQCGQLSKWNDVLERMTMCREWNEQVSECMRQKQIVSAVRAAKSYWLAVLL
jgi:hypothetical protein